LSPRWQISKLIQVVRKIESGVRRPEAAVNISLQLGLIEPRS
jgi:hypothetical protein